MADFTNMDRAAVHAVLVAKMQERFPSWSPAFAAEQANVFLELLEHLADGFFFNINHAARQAFIEWLQDPGALEQLARLAGYEIPKAAAATADLSFTIKTARQVDVPLAGVRVQTRSGVHFTVIGADKGPPTSIPGGELTLDVPATQVRTRVEVHTGTGAPDQVVTGSFTPWLDESVIVTVAGETWDRVWTRIADPVFDTGPAAHIYTVRTSPKGRLLVGFGDGVNGLPPGQGANIIVTYSQGGGTVGNVARTTVTDIQGTVLDDNGMPVADLSCTNADAASGGEDAEALAVSKLRIPRHMKTTNLTVALDDWIAHVEEVDGIARATVLTRALTGDDRLSPNTVYVRALPVAGGALTQQQIADITEAVTTTYPRTITLAVDVRDVTAGGVVDFTIENLSVKDGFDLPAVKTAVEAMLVALFDPLAVSTDGEFVWQFGSTVFWTQLVAAIQDVAGVESFDLSEPADDVELDADQFPSLGTVGWGA